MSNVVPLNQQQAGFFEYPQFDLSQLMYAHQQGAFLTSPPQSPYQLCELIYTPVNTPTGVALTPSLIPLSPREGPLYPTPMPSPVTLQASYVPQYQTPTRKEVNTEKVLRTPRMNDLVHGLPEEQWKAMTDKEREEFVKAKRRQEAFKTALCQGFMKTGECKFGDDCLFAHGRDELRLPKYNHPKYKTMLCRTYAVNGECPYGSRCQFIHEKYQGQIPQEYVLSVESTQVKKPRRKSKVNQSVQFSHGDEDQRCEFRGDKTCIEVREAKKELHSKNEKINIANLTETLNKLFDAKMPLSHS